MDHTKGLRFVVNEALILNQSHCNHLIVVKA